MLLLQPDFDDVIDICSQTGFVPLCYSCNLVLMTSQAMMINSDVFEQNDLQGVVGMAQLVKWSLLTPEIPSSNQVIQNFLVAFHK